jgi:drug/metabolite transporter (DMT)-like permease
VGTLIEALVAAVAAAWLFAEPLTAQQGVGALLLGAAMCWCWRGALPEAERSGRACQ